MSSILDFSDTLATHATLTGGKGCNLAKLTQQGFPVPNGFIITAQVYQDFISASGVNVPSDDAWHTASHEKRDALREIMHEQLSTASLPTAASQEILAKLTTFPPGTNFSVRSSSTMEDLADAAFAGQHETYLNVVTHDDVLLRIRDCFISLWTDRAIAYRTRQGFSHADATMAVVVQTMIQSEVAGVGFSINPITGDLNEMMINSNFGLGESVVSGEGEVDQWLIEKSNHQIRSRHIACKSHRIIATSTGTAETQASDTEALLPSLTDAQLEEVSALLLKVEQTYGFPQDIEWAIANDRLWLLQSRPVTTIPSNWTRDESAERFPNPVTPLTWDFVEDGFHRSLNHSFQLLGLPKYTGKWFAKFDHYIYGNQNAVELYARKSPFQISSLDDLRAIIPRLRDRYSWVNDLPLYWVRDLDHYLMKIGELRSLPLEGLTLQEAWQHVLDVNELGADYFLPNIAISITHSSLHRLLHSMMLTFAGEQQGDTWFQAIMAWTETKTSQINRELFELARHATATPNLADLLVTMAPREVLEQGKLTSFPQFQAHFLRFLRDHGHREVDFDAYVPTWIESPWIVLDHIRLLMTTPHEQTPSIREREQKLRATEAEHAFLSQIPDDLRFFFQELIRLARAYTALDDLEHYQTMRLTPPLRRALRAVGTHLVAQEVISDPMDVFFAHRQQIESAITSPSLEAWSTLREQILTQKESYLNATQTDPAWSLNATKELNVPISSDTLTGLSGSPGIAEGEIYLVTGPNDFSSFPKGAILVARTTNPAWTPLFYTASAVITESGGPLSHGAVTAREMNLPAVMSVRQCMRSLKNGQRVRVDGNAGRVELLQPT